jgi:hypothetical protein
MASRLAPFVGGVAARRALRELAHANGFDYTDEVQAAKVIMLCGPNWHGVLNLRGPQRAAFDSYIDNSIAKARQAGSRFA